MTGISEVPVLCPDGRLITQPGYDEQTGLLYLPNGDVPAIHNAPDEADVVNARDRLIDLVCDFPFERNCYRSTWLAALLTLVCRHAIDGPSPLFLLEANAMGAGKSLLTDLLFTIAFGRDAPRMGNPKNDEESKKEILSVALSGDPAVLIDNVVGQLGSPFLDAMLTGTSVKGRLLATNRVVEVPIETVWFASGNNIRLAPETPRRVCYCRLKTDEENPEERDGFKHPRLLEYVREHRLELLGDALTIVTGWYAAGQPSLTLPAWGSYESWTEVIRQTIVWIGMDDPAESRSELSSSCDDERSAHLMLVRAWMVIDHDGIGMTSAGLVRYAEDRKDSTDGPVIEFRDALIGLCSTKNGSLDPRSVGNKLRYLRDRVIGGLRIVRVDDGRYNRWKVECV